MNRKTIFFFFFGLIIAKTSPAQCPSRDSLWARLIFLRNSTTILPSEQLPELLDYASRMQNCSYKNDSTHEFLLRRIGAVYIQMADYLNAAKYLHWCIEMISANTGKPGIHSKQLVANYYWLSRCYDSLNMYSEKMKALDSCSAIALRLRIVDNPSLWALYARVENFFYIGDYERCIQYAIMCETLGNEYSRSRDLNAFEDGREYASSSLAWHVSALLTLKDYDRAEELLTNRVDEYKKEGFRNYLGIAYEQLAKVEIHKENYKKALFYFNQAISAERILGQFNRCRTLLSDIGYEIYFKHFKDPDQALHYYRKALYLLNRKDKPTLLDSMESLNILNYIADAYVLKDEFDSAFVNFQLAFDQIRPGITEWDILHSHSEDFSRYPKIYYITDLLIDKGNAYKKRFKISKRQTDLTDAIGIYKITDQLLERIKSEQFDLQSKLFWKADSHRLYEDAIEACYLLNNTGEAFYFFEKSRAILLNDQIRELNWLGKDDVHKQTQIKKKILRIEREIASLEKNSERLKGLQNELFASRRQLEDLIRIVEKRNPMFYSSVLDSGVISISELRREILKDQDTFLEFFSGDSSVYALMVSPGDIHVTKISKLRYDSLTNLFVSYISNLFLQNRDFQGFKRISFQLYKLIFSDYKIPSGRIIISPDGAYFPFESLVTRMEPITYLLKEHSISYAYSARFLMNRFVNPTDFSSHIFLGVAPVEYPSAFHLATLNGSDRSIQKIGSYFKEADFLVAQKASKNNFLQLFSEYPIVQLYTHASDASRNGEPVIYFSDSALYLSDIMGENKPVTGIIVLSACETGEGNLYKGEGVFSMNRAFAALGIPASISNLWSLDNVSTYKLTEQFYKYLSQGLPADRALQKAKLEFAEGDSKANQLPYFWAGTILIGKNYSFTGGSRFSWKLDLAVIMAMILLIWMVRWMFRKRSVLLNLRNINSRH